MYASGRRECVMLYDNLSQENGVLTVAGHRADDLVRQYGTPLLVMDEARIRNRCRTYKTAMEKYLPAGSRPLYASKALSIRQIYRIMAQEGMGVDVVSAGELYTAFSAGFPMEHVFFHGNAKTDRDIAFAMDHGLGWFVCDNETELAVIDREAKKRGLRQKILLRLTPGIDPHTHAKISTGRVDSKFGAAIETGQAEALVKAALAAENIDLQGYHCHIGSQIFEADPFMEGAEMMLSFVAQMRDALGFTAPVLNLGGGMAVPYKAEDPAICYEENIKTIGKIIDTLCQKLQLTPPVILMEPGRSIVADSGLTLYTVVGTKQIPGFKNYVAVDGGMADNPRYTLYQSAYTVLNASRMDNPADFHCTVAGCCCESGDLLQEDVDLPAPQRGDLLAVLTTGAYNYAMASNYNRLPRPPIVMLGAEGPYEAVRRETYEDLLKCDL